MRSMTGFGKAEGKVGTSHYTIEIKSVNHRYLDARFRMPGSMSAFEIPLGETLRSQFERGSFEISVKPRMAGQATMTGATRFVVDEAAMKSLMDAIGWCHTTYKTEKIPTLETLALTGRIFVPVEETPESSETLKDLRALFEIAVKDLRQMRDAEGKRLQTVLQEGLAELGKSVEALAKLAPEQPKKIGEKLTQRISQWQTTAAADPQRLEWEIAFYAERSDFTEEIDRLRMHLKEFADLLASPKCVGRKLDFVSQELHREVNTLASKAALVEITKLAVEGKTQIEKLREQVQNVE